MGGRLMEHEYALWGFDDKNRPVARENLTIEALNAVRDEKNLRTYRIKPMQGDPDAVDAVDAVDPPCKPPANRSFVRRPDGSYERVALGRWLRETYHLSDLDTSPGHIQAARRRRSSVVRRHHDDYTLVPAAAFASPPRSPTAPPRHPALSNNLTLVPWPNLSERAITP
jgi:hypothetical protein